MLDIRRSLLLRDTLTSELGKPGARPVVRAAVLAAIANPFAGRYVEDLTQLFEAGRSLGDQLMAELVGMLPHPAVSYGKGAIVGMSGEFEHGGACIHPMLGKPMRAAIGGGKAVIPSNVKIAGPGTWLDVPLSHKDDSWSFDHFDTITVAMPDAPRPDEIVVVLALADGGRLHPRCGQAPR
ncbi:MAG: amino acid synthesis family protein [Xanthobacteraceae bacterium]